jgi:hypothetical protein
VQPLVLPQNSVGGHSKFGVRCTEKIGERGPRQLLRRQPQALGFITQFCGL